ncbi:hypothetical protein HPB52_007194 [Rhipicephalus sanguineus]|uniref:Uncharacterized protein n=1 Tax=Rhipicephalus sanguineus TaxID=34632 RepID=A0A9D4T8S7_RHISA|nr:hypothetical protein HPB52_007194 [Rhipicephalus sanguineus]
MKAASKMLPQKATPGNIGNRVAAKKPLLSGQNKIARLRFANDHRSWSVCDWKSVVFSDESTFSTRWDQQQRVWRLQGTRFTQENLKHVAGSGRTAVNVWGAISFQGLGPLPGECDNFWMLEESAALNGRQRELILA